MIKLSIIVPTKNNSKYLKRCIDSLLNQTFKNFEVIIVSDSKLDSKIAREFELKDKRVKVLNNINKGLGGARNAGLEIAQGEFISFVDSDDWLEENTYEFILKKFKDNIDLVVFGVNVTGEKKYIPNGLVNYMTLKYKNEQKIHKDLIFNTNVSAWNKVYKKSIIDKYNLKFPENMQYEDFPFYFQYMLVSESAYYLPGQFYNYFQHANSGMQKTYNHDYASIVDHINGCYYLYLQLINKSLIVLSQDIFIEIYARWTMTALRHCTNKDKIKLLHYAFSIYKKMNFIGYKKSSTLKLLKNKNFKDIIIELEWIKEYRLFGIFPFLQKKRYRTGKEKMFLFNLLKLYSVSVMRGFV